MGHGNRNMQERKPGGMNPLLSLFLLLPCHSPCRTATCQSKRWAKPPSKSIPSTFNWPFGLMDSQIPNRVCKCYYFIKFHWCFWKDPEHAHSSLSDESTEIRDTLGHYTLFFPTAEKASLTDKTWCGSTTTVKGWGWWTKKISSIMLLSPMPTTKHGKVTSVQEILGGW